MAKQRERTVSLGHVTVDSGRLLIIDPSYLRLLSGPPEQLPEVSPSPVRPQHSDQSREVVVSGNATAIITATGLGDGQYEIEAIVGPMPAWGPGERVRSITITFLEPGER